MPKTETDSKVRNISVDILDLAEFKQDSLDFHKGFRAELKDINRKLMQDIDCIYDKFSDVQTDLDSKHKEMFKKHMGMCFGDRI